MKTMRISSVVLVLLGLLGPAAADEPSNAPYYARRDPLAIRGLTGPDRPVARFARAEFTVDLTASFDNPFDSSDVALDAEVTCPDGRKAAVAGFFFQDFDRKLEKNREVLTPRGKAKWLVRFTPTVPGDYSITVSARDRSGTTRSKPVRFRAAPSDDPGFVRVSPRDPRYFEFDNKQAFFPIGLNLCWPGERGTYDYDDWIPAFTKAGCNASRLWLAPGWNRLALERTAKGDPAAGIGRFDLQAAWRLDYVLEQAARHGLYLKLCFDSYNILREKEGYPFWDQTPHNAANGGPLKRAVDFWTDPTMDRAYREKLRYMTARYGGVTHVLAWEFWNEVDIISDYRPSLVGRWHRRMATYLRSIDPYAHLITTSFAGLGDPKIEELDEIDYVQTHLYHGLDLPVKLAEYQKRKEAFGKPHYVGEVGADAGGTRFADDPQGLQIHDPLWVTLAGGGSGAAQVWYWETVHSHRLHPLYAAAAKFVRGIDWPAEGMRCVTPEFRWKTPPKPVPLRDLLLPTAQPSWSSSEYNRPRTVRVDAKGVRGDLPLPGIQHGIGGHKDKHNPIRFETNVPRPIRIVVGVQGVSGWGGATLEMRLDGKPMLKKNFANTNPPDNHDTLMQYAGAYGIDVPAGRHTVDVENRGQDWFLCGYEVQGAVECTGPMLLGWATVGKNTALVWVRPEQRTWHRLCVKKEASPAVPPSRMVLPKMASGRWEAELWDTWSGEVVGRETVTVGSGGDAELDLPVIEKDLAVRLRRASE